MGTRSLALGREYSNLTRESKGVTVYDEVALSNDINAACAGANASRGLTPPAAVSVNPEQRLARLDDLRSKRLISDEEYASERRRILADL